MSYPRQLRRVRPRGGIANDAPAWTLPEQFLSQGDNAIFRLGMAERAPSVETVYDPPSVAPYCLLNTRIGGTNFWVYAGASAMYAVETTNHTDITHASGQQTNTDVSQLSLELLNGVPIFNNALDEPMYWDGSPANNFVDLPDWTATESCDFIVPHRFHLFAFSINGPSGNFPNQVKWSDAADPGNVPASWTPSASNEAGDTILADTPGEIIGARNLRDSLLIYKTGSTHVCNYIGGQEIFQFRTAFVEAGALCRHGIADINGRHFVVTDGDIIVTDGVNIESIAQNRLKRTLFNALDQNNYQNLFAVYYRKHNEVWLCYPEAGSSVCTRALIYDVANNAWGERELPGVSFGATGIINDTAVDETWDADSEVWDADLSEWDRQNFSLATEELVLADPTNTEFLEVGRGSQSLTTTLARYDLDFGEPERFKFIKRAYLRADADSSIDFSIRIGTRATLGESISWSAAQSLNTAMSHIDFLKMGRYVSFEISATTDRVFKVTGLDIEFELRGYHA